MSNLSRIIGVVIAVLPTATLMVFVWRVDKVLFSIIFGTLAFVGITLFGVILASGVIK